MFSAHTVQWDHYHYDAMLKQITPGRNALLLMIKHRRVDHNVRYVQADVDRNVKYRGP